eukprot:COSAG01_NODE_10_length_42970_cov_93.010007_51_plen_492_part_00
MPRIGGGRIVLYYRMRTHALGHASHRARARRRRRRPPRRGGGRPEHARRPEKGGGGAGRALRPQRTLRSAPSISCREMRVAHPRLSRCTASRRLLAAQRVARTFSAGSGGGGNLHVGEKDTEGLTSVEMAGPQDFVTTGKYSEQCLEHSQLSFLRSNWTAHEPLLLDRNGHVLDHQAIRAEVGIHFVKGRIPAPSQSTAAAQRLRQHGFFFFCAREHYSINQTVTEFANKLDNNASESAPLGQSGSKEQAAFEERAISLLRGTLSPVPTATAGSGGSMMLGEGDADSGDSSMIMVPTSTVYRKATAEPSSSGAKFVHLDVDVSNNESTDLAPNLWQQWRQKFLLHPDVVETAGFKSRLEHIDSTVEHEYRLDAELQLFNEMFDVVSFMNVWVNLNVVACNNFPLAMCSADSMRRSDLTPYILGQNGHFTATGMHNHHRHKWYAPDSLQLGEGVIMNSKTAAHSAIFRANKAPTPRHSVECRVLYLRRKGAP